MPTGKVKWFSPEMGYGFILPDDGSKEVFVHVSAVRKSGLGSLSEGMQVSYDLVNFLGKRAVRNLCIAQAQPADFQKTTEVVAPDLAFGQVRT